ncbi:MAG: sugar phosphate isomerase/epimerase family protein [Planctomycetota bacterium]
MIVAATTECFAELALDEALERILELEFSNVEIAIDETGRQIKPSEVASDLDRAILRCRNTHRMDVAAYSLNIKAQGEDFYQQFTACCKLAKATKVVTLAIPSAELGTPFNEEVENLRRLVGIARVEGVRVALRSQIGCQSQDPDTVMVLCDNVPGLGLALDPSHYICGPHAGRSIDKIMKYVYHVHLRDTSKKELQVRVGQGEIDYNRLISQLRKLNYNRALSVNIKPMNDVDHPGELRKLRLLLETLL